MNSNHTNIKTKEMSTILPQKFLTIRLYQLLWKYFELRLSKEKSGYVVGWRKSPERKIEEFQDVKKYWEITYGGGDLWGIMWIFHVASEHEFSSAA